MADPDAYTTGHLFTVSSSAGTLATVLYPTPGTAALPGRPCRSVTYAAAITDDCNFCYPVATLIPQYNQPIYMKFGFGTAVLATGGAKAEFLAGLNVVGTGLIATPATNYINVRKKVDETVFQLVCRKASGTESAFTIPNTTVGDTGDWWDFSLKILRDPTTLGRGRVDLKVWKNGTPMWEGPIEIATQFPDTVAMAPAISTRVGVASNVTYLSHLMYQVGPTY